MDAQQSCRRWLMIGWLLLAWAGAAEQALAATAGDLGDLRGEALLIGSRRGGAGQQPLQFTEQDVRRLEAVLTELGGYPADRVQLLLDPTVEGLRTALAGVRERLARHQARGERTVFFYYYSGHARAQALSLGDEELPLPVLKAELEALPATLKLVVLDACQSGALSGIKGVQPAAAFSVNSVAGLDTSGLAVLASSSGSELSQESDRLHGSFFTHHLVTGLRGAADADADGRVTLAEAYKYAYHRTLITTAATAIGKQHVTLETALKGKGELVLTTAARAVAQLELPAALEAGVLIHRQPGPLVMAEVQKAPGLAMQLALPPGHYVALVRREPGLEQCELRLDAGQRLDLTTLTCQAIREEEAEAKGAGPAPVLPPWALELSLGLLLAREDDYNQRLEDFGYDPGLELWARRYPSFQFSLVRHLSDRAALVLNVSSLDQGRYQRELRQYGSEVTTSEQFDWWAGKLGLLLRGSLPLWNGRVIPYVEGGGGLAVGFTRLSGGLRQLDDPERHHGYQLSLATGLQVMPWRHFGFFGRGGYTHAPVIDNLLGDTHDSGGFDLALGVRGAF